MVKIATRKYISFDNLSKFLDNLKNIFATKTEMNAKSDKTHKHAISDITNLQSTLDGKAASSHGTHVAYSTATPVMDGTASVGSASTVARSDHKHPTDTSRAAQTSLDSHTSNTTSHITSTERTNWNAAYTHSQSAHAPSNAEPNQNAFSNVKIGDVTIAADIKTDTLTLVAGNNITLTPDATNDKITIAAKDTTYTLGSFGVTATASELNKLDGVTATTTELNYVDGVTSNIQNQLDGKAASSHTHKVANISDLTATATELNYMDGVKSNVQTQLDTLTTTVNGKANASHTHQYAGSSSVGGDANNALKLEGYNRSNLYKDLPTWINAVGLTRSIVVEGDKDTYYPVRIYLPSSKSMPTYVSIHKNLGTRTPEIEGNHSNGTSSMWLIYEGRNRSWDGNGGYLKTWYRYMGYANLCAHAEAGTSAVGDLLVWLRGGGCLYEITETANTTEPAVYYEETNIGTEDYPYMVAPRTDLGNKGIYSSTLGYGNIEGNATTATKATQDSNGNVIASTYETKTNATNKLAEAKTYADNTANKVKNDLLNGAGTAYDTLKELGELITDNQDAIEVLENVAAGKANASHIHAISDVTNLQTTLNGKQATITGGASTIASSNLTASRALVSDSSGKVAVSAVTSTELGYLDGVTSNVQTQLNGKSASGHTHNYAGSSSAGGAANSAIKATQDASGNVITSTYATKTELDTAKSNLQTSINGKANSSHTHTIANITNLQSTLDGKSNTSHTHSYAGSSSVGGSATSAVKLDTSTAGDSNTPVYFSGGKPVACTSLDLNTSGSSASCTGNSATATKLQTARTIGLGTGATGTATSFNGSANITIPVTDVKESYLSWGGKNLAGGVSPVDAACSNIHSANRFTFAKPAGITIEYSTNGSTYSAYSTTDSAKVNLVSGIGSVYYIGARSSSTTVNDKLRITLNATNMGVYTLLRKLLINISTGYSTGSNVIIEKAMKGSETTFKSVGTYNISGWSGWNSIPINAAFGGGDTQTSNIAVLRLTFGITGVNSEQTANALTILDIIGIGDTYWSYPSTMAKTGHIYNYDSSQNVTFPASISGTGTLSMNRKANTTVGNYSVALGYGCTSSSYGSHAEGDGTTASGLDAHSEGRGTTASGYHSHAQGIGTTASGTGSHAEGTTTTASGMYCHAEGSVTTAKGYQTHAEGSGTIAAGSDQHAQGRYNIEDTSYKYAHIVGNGDSTTRSNAHTLDWSGNAWYAGDVYVGGTDQSSGTKLVKSTDTIPVANGGTGATTAAAALQNLGLTATATELNYIDGVTSNIQTQLNGKSSTSHTHTADALVSMANVLFATSSNGGVEYSYGSDSGKNVLTEISNMTSGLHTLYSIAGTTGNPNTTESWRMLVHKTSTTIGWVLAFDAQGSIYSNYQSAAGTFKGWKCIYDAAPPILWMGEYWCTDTQTVTPSKALSACRNGWVLVWSDYDTENEKATNGDCFTTVIPKWNPNHVKWSGQSFIAAVPTNLTAEGAISFAGKRLYVHDTKITGNTVNDVAPANDVCLRAIYEY